MRFVILWVTSLVWPAALSLTAFYGLLEELVGLLLIASYLLWLLINVYRTLFKTGDGPDWSSLSKLASQLKKYYGNLGLESWSRAFALLERIGDRADGTYVATKILNASTDDEVTLALKDSEMLVELIEREYEDGT